MRNLLQSIKQRREERGSTVVLSIIVIIVLAMFVSAALDYTMQSLRFSQRSNARAQALDAATGTLDNTFVQWRQACRSQENMPMASGSISSYLSNPSYSSILTSGSNGAGFLNATTPVSVTLHALNGTVPVSEGILSSSSATPIPTYAEGPNMPTYSYLAQVTVNYQTLVGGIGTGGNNSLTVSRIFQKVTSSPWLYALFYNDDLEINPGSAMAITGQVQTNGNLYTGGNGGNNLTFDSSVTYAGNWDSAGQWDPDDTYHSGTPYGPNYSTEPSAGPEQTPENSTVLTAAPSSPSNPNQADGYHEIIDAPNSAYSDPMASSNSQDPSERIYNQAGVIIKITGAAVTIMDSSGVVCSSTSANATDKAIYNTFNAAITTNASLKDAREGTTLTIDQLDISKIESALTSGGSLYGDGCNIVYIYNTGYNTVSGATAPANQNGSAAVGIELVNGYQMPTGGLTIASENPVYIMGDYNTAATKTANMTNVLSNQSTSNESEPYASGYTVQPCAVMADAVTILSNAWSNSVTSSMPTASNTTINTAILSGIVTSARSGSGQTFDYSGGAENFLRLLENWSGKLLTYYGSMDEMFTSKQATGVWQATGNYYNPPTRQWFFNVGFYTSPPPGTFKAISYVRSRWYTQ